MKRTVLLTLTLCTAALFAGGCGSSNLVSSEEASRKEAADLQEIQARIAKERKVDPLQVPIEEIQKDPKVKALGLDSPDQAAMVERALGADLESLPPVQNLTGYKKIDFADKNAAVLKYTAMKSESPAQPPTPVDFKTAFEHAQLLVYQLKITTDQGAVPPQPKQPAVKKPPMVREIFFGPVDKKLAEEQFKQAQQSPTLKIEVLKTYPASLYANDKGRVVAVVGGGYKFPQRLGGSPNMMYYRQSPEIVKKLQDESKANPKTRMPMPVQIGVATPG